MVVSGTALKGVQRKYVVLLKSLYSRSVNRVRAYGELSEELTTTSGVRQGCPLSLFLFNFVIDVLMEVTLSTTDFPGVDVLPGNKVVDLEYADDIVLLGKDTDKMQNLLDTLSSLI